MPSIDLATESLQIATKAVVDATKTKVDTLDTRTNTTNNTVNTTNTNVNSIKTTVETTRTELATVDALVDDLITRLGVPNTAQSNATTSNAHAKLNWLLSALSTVSTNTATSNLGAPTATASNNPNSVAHAKLNYLIANMPSGVVNSVQKGIASNASSVTISAVNVNKSIVLVSGYGTGPASGIFGFVGAELRTSTSITLAAAISGSLVYWQVIEFY